jgi:hypothetical protein
MRYIVAVIRSRAGAETGHGTARRRASGKRVQVSHSKHEFVHDGTIETALFLRFTAFSDLGLENLLSYAIRALHPSLQVVRWSIARVGISLALQGFLSAGKERPLAPEPGA